MSTVLDTMYPPVVDTYQPSFIYTENAKIYFSISSYSSDNIDKIKYVHLSMVSHKTNKTAFRGTDENENIVSPSVLIIPWEGIQQDDNKKQYYISLDPKYLGTAYKNSITEGTEYRFGLTTYKIQLRFDLNKDNASKPDGYFYNTPIGGTNISNLSTYLNDNSDYFTEWSKSTLIKPIFVPKLTCYINDTDQILFAASKGYTPPSYDGINGTDIVSIHPDSSVEISGYLSFVNYEHKYFSSISSVVQYLSWYQIFINGTWSEILYPTESNKIETTIDASNLATDSNYELIIKICTNGGYENNYILKLKIDAYDNETPGTLTATIDEDNGLNIVNYSVDTDLENLKFDGKLSLSAYRSSNRSNYKKWELLKTANAQEYITQKSSILSSSWTIIEPEENILSETITQDSENNYFSINLSYTEDLPSTTPMILLLHTDNEETDEYFRYGEIEIELNQEESTLLILKKYVNKLLQLNYPLRIYLIPNNNSITYDSFHRPEGVPGIECPCLKTIQSDIWLYLNLEISKNSTNDTTFIIKHLFLFNKNANIAISYSFTDNTIESMIGYKYNIQLCDDSGSYKPKETDEIIVNDFYGALISDKDRQLKISYDFAINQRTLKVNRAISDTLGGKYPILTQNENLKYHQYTFSGKISVLEDELNLFTSEAELLGEEYAEKYNIVSDSITYASKECTSDSTATMPHSRKKYSPQENWLLEREYRDLVEDWLNNGEAKLFRSMTEGNFIIVLDSISLSPEKTLGNRIYDVSATMYEIGDGSDLESLRSFDIIE